MDGICAYGQYTVIALLERRKRKKIKLDPRSFSDRFPRDIYLEKKFRSVTCGMMKIMDSLFLFIPFILFLYSFLPSFRSSRDSPEKKRKKKKRKKNQICWKSCWTSFDQIGSNFWYIEILRDSEYLRSYASAHAHTCALTYVHMRAFTYECNNTQVAEIGKD
jgi:hypothetical protein